MLRLILAGSCLFVLGGTAGADDWPDFLGPQRNATSAEKNLNWDWDKKKPEVLWKVSLGSGYGALTIVGDRAFAMAKRGQRDIIVCLSAKDGKEQWHFDLAPTFLDTQRHCAGPRATPIFHHEKLYCLMPMGELICISADGKRKIWERNIFQDTGAKNPNPQFYYWGISYSPLVEGDVVIVNPGGDNTAVPFKNKQGGSDSAKHTGVAAFHKDTGKLIWTAADSPVGYASPIAITHHQQRQLVVPTGQAVFGIEPTKGEVLWSYSFGNQFNATGANPVWADNLLLVSAAYGGGSAVLDLVKENGHWSVREKWKDKKALQALFATSVVHEGYIYGINGDLGAITLRCVELRTGKAKWQERLDGRSHMLLVDGHLLVWSERGQLSVVEARPDQFKLKHQWPELLAFKSWAAPALANGKLFLRDERHALCLDLRR